MMQFILCFYFMAALASSSQSELARLQELPAFDNFINTLVSVATVCGIPEPERFYDMSKVPWTSYTVDARCIINVLECNGSKWSVKIESYSDASLLVGIVKNGGQVTSFAYNPHDPNSLTNLHNLCISRNGQIQ